MDEPKHFRHGPSSAHRWLICSDAPNAEAPYPDDTTDAADEGTAAHWLLEQCLKAGQDCQDFVKCLPGPGICVGAGKSEDGTAYISAGEETGCLKNWPITGEMIEGVQLAIDTVKDDLNKKGTRAFFEERVRLDHALGLPHPVGGTADIILYLPRSKTLKVLDFKFGKGHVVEVTAGGRVWQERDDGTWEEVGANEVLGFDFNPQLGLYGLAAMTELERLLGEKREVKWIELTVIQPRAHHKKGPVRTKKLAPLQFMHLEGALVKALFGSPVRIAGDHCGFCKAYRDCETRRLAHGSVALKDFEAEAEATAVQVPAAVTPAAAPTHEGQTPGSLNLMVAIKQPPSSFKLETLGQIRPLLKVMEKWIEDVKAEIKTRLLNDLQVPGAKLGVGRGSRSYGGDKSEQYAAAEQTAMALGLTYDDLYEPATLKSPAKLEKELGAARFKETPLAQLVTYVEGGPIVVDADADVREYVKGDGFAAEAPDTAQVSHPLL